MQVRRIRYGVAGRSHKTEDVAFMNNHSFMGSWCVAIQVSVIVAVDLQRIELVERVAAKSAVKQLGDRAVADCKDRRTARCHDVGRLVRLTIGPGLNEGVT